MADKLNHDNVCNALDAKGVDFDFYDGEEPRYVVRVRNGLDLYYPDDKPGDRARLLALAGLKGA